jgi:hypothetical protein
VSNSATNVSRLIKEAVEFVGSEYRELNLTTCYPMDIEDFFRALPDRPGVIVFSEYDRADTYIQNLINFTVLYYEYRKMITYGDSVPVSNRWKFILIAKPDYWFDDSTVYKRSYHISF